MNFNKCIIVLKEIKIYLQKRYYAKSRIFRSNTVNPGKNK
jgi:hypothetical protein